MPVPARAPVPLRIVDKHLVFDGNGETCLLDTGVPWSMPAPDMVSDALGVRVETTSGRAVAIFDTGAARWPLRGNHSATAVSAGRGLVSHTGSRRNRLLNVRAAPAL